MARILVFVCLIALLGLPLVFRQSRAVPPDDARELIIITPHREMIRNEFGAAFDAWHDANYGERVNVVWSQPGGTSEIRKMLVSQFTAALETGLKPGGNADLVFGGGEYEHQVLKEGVEIEIDGETRRSSISAPVHFDEAWLEAIYGPNEIGSNMLYDPEGYWFGTALAGFGIVYNNDVLAQLGVPTPTIWSDLCDPRLMHWVALGNPAQSGSIQKSFDTVLQRRGWFHGWCILRRMGANARYFSASSSKIPIDVGGGEAAAGVCIDFYGRFESQAIDEAEPWRKTPRIGYVDPPGLSAIDADPISMLMNPPNGDVARRFIEFCLTDQAQALWQFRVEDREIDGLGPQWRELRRMPIRRSMYKTHFDRFVDPVNPFELARPFDDYHRAYWSFITPLFAGAVMDNHHDLQAAWNAIINHPAYPADAQGLVMAADVTDPTLRRMLELLDAMPQLPSPDGTMLSLATNEHLDELKAGWLRGGWSGSGLWPSEASSAAAARRSFGAFFRGQYRQIIQLAKQQG
jgi:ABC-type Fe3+ transport system substrate-binding protein